MFGEAMVISERTCGSLLIVLRAWMVGEEIDRETRSRAGVGLHFYIDLDPVGREATSSSLIGMLGSWSPLWRDFPTKFLLNFGFQITTGTPDFISTELRISDFPTKLIMQL